MTPTPSTLLTIHSLLSSLHPTPITAIQSIAREDEALRVRFRSDEKLYDATLSPNDAPEEQILIHPLTPLTNDRTDEGVRLCDLDRMGSRYRFGGGLFVPNQPYRQGDRFVVLAAKNGFVRKIKFSPNDVDPRFITKDPYSPTYWANLFFSFEAVDEEDDTEGEGIEEEVIDAAEGRSDEVMEVNGELLDDDVFDAIAEVSEGDVMAALEEIVK